MFGKNIILIKKNMSNIKLYCISTRITNKNKRLMSKTKLFLIVKKVIYNKNSQNNHAKK